MHRTADNGTIQRHSLLWYVEDAEHVTGCAELIGAQL
jgi:hypothetical protein